MNSMHGVAGGGPVPAAIHKNYAPRGTQWTAGSRTNLPPSPLWRTNRVTYSFFRIFKRDETKPSFSRSVPSAVSFERCGELLDFTARRTHAPPDDYIKQVSIVLVYEKLYKKWKTLATMPWPATALQTVAQPVVEQRRRYNYLTILSGSCSVLLGIARIQTSSRL